MTPPLSNHVTVVTVTYADRQMLICTGLEALTEQGVTRVVVVDNGASWAVSPELHARYGDFVDVVEIGRNSGSAGGYAAGIRRAMDLGAEYIWLLDDDNRPAAGCLATLLATYKRLRVDHAADRLAVLAFRRDHQADVAADVPLHRINPRPNAFRRFHILDIPYKLWCRTPWGRPRMRESLPALVDLTVAPYSGLLFHRAVVESIGLPRQDFVLYADDLEYTHRLVRSGGRIAMVTAASLEDLESSWYLRQRSGTSIDALLSQGSDFRVYYATRNSAYFNAHCQSHGGWVFWLNRRVFLATLFLHAQLTGRTERYRLVVQAINDGLSGRLGPDRRFPL